MRPEFSGLSFTAGFACGVVSVFATLGVVFAAWLIAHWLKEQRRLARLSQLERDVEELENRRQALGLKTPPRIEPIRPVKQANRE
jgi:hypothetical protein